MNPGARIAEHSIRSPNEARSLALTQLSRFSKRRRRPAVGAEEVPRGFAHAKRFSPIISRHDVDGLVGLGTFDGAPVVASVFAYHQTVLLRRCKSRMVVGDTSNKNNYFIFSI